ncbi:hypothetical protein J6590_048610 [Homalodisca vitripennis]|nr:hypothetical protein J6590_102884 [Homalodisca vitripennis]KAG8326198.1 hypothetical protein J6590_048610 [Homalodisca vitripennis]
MLNLLNPIDRADGRDKGGRCSVGGRKKHREVFIFNHNSSKEGSALAEIIDNVFGRLSGELSGRYRSGLLSAVHCLTADAVVDVIIIVVKLNYTKVTASKDISVATYSVGAVCVEATPERS